MSWQPDPVIHDSILFNTVDGEGGGPALCSDTHKVMFCVGWFFDFVITSSSRFFERFKIQESPVLGFFNSKVQNKITADSGSNWFFYFLRATGQEFKILGHYSLVLSLKERPA
jgi:hypothetical protein